MGVTVGGHFLQVHRLASNVLFNAVLKDEYFRFTCRLRTHGNYKRKKKMVVFPDEQQSAYADFDHAGCQLYQGPWTNILLLWHSGNNSNSATRDFHGDMCLHDLTIPFEKRNPLCPESLQVDGKIVYLDCGTHRVTREEGVLGDLEAFERDGGKSGGKKRDKTYKCNPEERAAAKNLDPSAQGNVLSIRKPSYVSSLEGFNVSDMIGNQALSESTATALSSSKRNESNALSGSERNESNALFGTERDDSSALSGTDRNESSSNAESQVSHHSERSSTNESSSQSSSRRAIELTDTDAESQVSRHSKRSSTNESHSQTNDENAEPTKDSNKRVRMI
jgi:hypothetical protein